MASRAILAHRDVLTHLGREVADHVADGAFELLGVDEFLVVEHVVREPGLDLPVDDPLDDVLRLALGLGLEGDDLPLLGERIAGSTSSRVTHVGLPQPMCMAMSSAIWRNSSLLATKSVSEASSTRTPITGRSVWIWM